MIYKRKTFIVLLFLLLIPIISISNFSLWIDEGTTAFLASFNSYSNLVNYLIHYTGSEAQMPGYIIFIWIWAKLFGISEIALRAANIPFYILFILSIYKSSFSRRMKVILLSIVTLNPFIWYNMNEVRNTLIVFFLAFIIIINLLEYFNNEQKLKNIYILGFTFVIGIAFNLLFYFLIIPIIYLSVNYIIKNNIRLKQLLDDIKIPLISTIILSLLLLIYYFFTLSHGAGGMRQRPGIANIGETLYEFLGFLGLGPSRNEIRDKTSVSLFLNYKYTLITYSGLIVLAIVVFSLFFKKLKKTNIIFKNNFLIAFLSSIVFFFIVSYIMHFRFWGRHVSFAYPLLILYLASIIDAIIALKPPKYFFYILTLILLFCTFSSLQIRFNPKYQKDNYKLAAKIIIRLVRNNNFNVVWAGNDLTAEYYGLYFADTTYISSFPRIVRVYNDDIFENESQINNKKKIIVLFKKYDLFDPTGYWRNYIARNNYKKIEDTQDFLIYGQKN